MHTTHPKHVHLRTVKPSAQVRHHHKHGPDHHATNIFDCISVANHNFRPALQEFCHLTHILHTACQIYLGIKHNNLPFHHFDLQCNNYTDSIISSANHTITTPTFLRHSHPFPGLRWTEDFGDI